MEHKIVSPTRRYLQILPAPILPCWGLDMVEACLSTRKGFWVGSSASNVSVLRGGRHFKRWSQKRRQRMQCSEGIACDQREFLRWARLPTNPAAPWLPVSPHDPISLAQVLVPSSKTWCHHVIRSLSRVSRCQCHTLGPPAVWELKFSERNQHLQGCLTDESTSDCGEAVMFQVQSPVTIYLGLSLSPKQPFPPCTPWLNILVTTAWTFGDDLVVPPASTNPKLRIPSGGTWGLLQRSPQLFWNLPM